MGIIRSQHGRGQLAAFNLQRHGGCVIITDSRVKAAIKKVYIVYIHGIWLMDHGASRSEIDRKPTKCFLDLYTQKISRSDEQKSHRNHKNKVMVSQLFPRRKPVYRPRFLEERPWYTTKNLYCSFFFQPSPKGPTAFYQGNCAFLEFWTLALD